MNYYTDDKEGDMDGLLELEPVWSDTGLADFLEETAAPTRPVADAESDHLAWLFAQAARSDELGAVNGADVRDRVERIVRSLSVAPATPEIIDEIIILRDECRWQRNWSSVEAEWPLLSA
jgi:hypothetical protein